MVMRPFGSPEPQWLLPFAAAAAEWAQVVMRPFAASAAEWAQVAMRPFGANCAAMAPGNVLYRAGGFLVAGRRIELRTPAFSAQCSTN